MPDDQGKVIPVMVALRCRPLIDKEKLEGCQPVLKMVPGEPQVVLGKDRPFTYDFAFSASDPQAEVYEKSCKGLIESIFKGYNATILAYGQTGSGKTYTMGGIYEDSLGGQEDCMGVIPRVLRDLYLGMDERRETLDFTVSVSYMEIYNEEVLCLLCPGPQREPLNIRDEGHQGGIRVQGLSEVEVSSYEETMERLSLGSQSRTTGATNMNNTSSRSHAIFTVNIVQKKKEDNNDCCKVKFHLVDLAGSERCSRTGAEGLRFKEGVNINKGLLMLGNVISALGEPGPNKKHIPYRDSKLTRILQDSLGGNSHTLMIACVSPADSNIEETLNTLRYADRARKIKNKPIINRDPQAAEILRLKTLVHDLQGQLIGGGASLATTVTSSKTQPGLSSSSSVEELSKLRLRIKELERENDHLAKGLRCSVTESTSMLEQVMKLEALNERLQAKLEAIKRQSGVNFDLLSSSIDAEAHPDAKAEIDKLQRLREVVEEKDDEEEEAEDEEDEEKEEDEEVASDEERESSDKANETRAIQQKHTLRQAELHKQLSQVMKDINSKQALAAAFSRPDSEMESLQTKYDTMMAEWKSRTEQLEKEKSQLTTTLADTQANSKAMKVSEQRRRRLKELETEMSGLKKKMTEQSRVVKLKEGADKQVGKLNNEIMALKKARVQLMKQMRSETAQFTKWKREKDKEVMKLQNKDRKREACMKKMKNDFDKHQTVQKRKTEEAIAANKRLKDALDRQKMVAGERTKALEKADSASVGDRVRKWLSFELDVKVSLQETKHHLASLFDTRKEMTEQLLRLKDSLEGGPLQQKFSWLGDNGDTADISMEEKEIQKQISSTEMDIELTNLNISEMQQKIVEADLESKGKSTFQSVHTMSEAKIALKFLLEQAVSARADYVKTSGVLRDVEDREKDQGEMCRELKAEISRVKARYEREAAKLVADHEEKQLFLLNADSKTPNSKLTDKLTMQKLKLLEAKVARLSGVEAALAEKETELANMKEKMTSMMYKTKAYSLFGDISSADPGSTSPFMNPRLKMEEDTSLTSLNSTFVVDEPPAPAPPPARKPLQAKRAPKTTLSAEAVNPEKKRAKTTTTTQPMRKTRSRVALGDAGNTQDAMGDKTNSSGDSTAEESDVKIDLKRRSGDEAPDADAETSIERRKRRKRTLLATSNKGFFAELEME